MTKSTPLAIPQDARVQRVIALLETQGFLPKAQSKAKPQSSPNLWTAYFTGGAAPLVVTAETFALARTLVLDCLDQWYSDNPQPNGHRPVELVVIEKGDTRSHE